MKTKTNNLKILVLLLISVLLIYSSCEKEDKVYTNLSGDWDLHYDFTTINKEVDAEMTLNQNGTNLSGKIEDSKDVFTLLQSCCINGYQITIKYYVAGELLKQTGTVNSDFNEMSGSFTLRGMYVGTWEADRSKKRSARINQENNTLKTVVGYLNKY
ncbi:MAG: hypothetical protein DRJ02_10730 [Bacteroidetes bacterium]|nr:MAG: hypothetical protein DRI87_09630 [Bacteroidota bacterium]RLD85239.1 MAG: hypothetical protein DRJ02_10730 [Bacteroidota bacterium]